MIKLTIFGVFALISMATASFANAQASADVIRVQTPRGASVPYLLTRGEATSVQAVYVLLSGGYGEHLLSQRGTVVQVFNDLRLPARLRELLAVDGATALVDVASDRNLLSDDYRISEAHTQDVAAVVADLRQRYPAARLVLLGHSNGTLSAAHAAARLGTQVDRVVLMGARLVAHWFAGDALAKFDFGQIKAPLLMVHHVGDACSVTPYAAAKALGDRYPLISVNGPPSVDAGGCTAQGTHGLSGREGAVAAAIRAWVQGQAWPQSID